MMTPVRTKTIADESCPSTRLFNHIVQQRPDVELFSRPFHERVDKSTVHKQAPTGRSPEDMRRSLLFPAEAGEVDESSKHPKPRRPDNSRGSQEVVSFSNLRVRRFGKRHSCVLGPDGIP